MNYMLKLHEDTLPKKDATPALHAIRTGRGLRGSKKLKPGALSLYVGDGHRAAVESVGDYHLDLSSRLVIVLTNYHYAPSITRGKCVSCMPRKMERKPYSPQVEKAKDLLELLHTDSFWNYSLETVARILNMVPTKKVDKKPYEILHGIPKGTIGYSFYSPFENKVFVAWNTEFFENDLIDLKASGSVKDLELIQEEDTNPSLDTSLDHEEDDQEIDKPQSDINPIQKSPRTCRAPDRICLYIDAKKHELRDLGEPANYKAVLLDLESKKWLDAINVETQSMKDNDVWVLVELPPNTRTLGSKWIFKKKTDMDDAVKVFKAHRVVKGFTQTYRVDYEETFSHVTDIRAIRIFIAIVVYCEYKIWKWIEPISMYCDNTGAIAITKDDEATKGTRHFHLKVHYLHETIKLDDVKIEKVDTDDNLVDPFTKALAFPKHSELTRNMKMLPARSFMKDGTNNQFTKIYTIKVDDKWLINWVLGFRSNGEVVMELDADNYKVSRISIYQPLSRHINDVGINGDLRTLYAWSYMETLLLLDEADSIIH
nr:hypothetical protein [Tanacetum cinerariifolium]